MRVNGAEGGQQDISATSDDLYDTLGVASDASAQDLTTAYRRLADQQGEDSAAAPPADLGVVSDAYEILRDPERRRSYDATQRHRRSEADAAAGFRIPLRRPGPSGPAGGDLPDQIELPLTFEQAVLGTTATVEVPSVLACLACRGSGEVPGPPCSACDGAGHALRRSGGIAIRRTCDACGGSGSTAPAACAHCGGRGRTETSKDIRLRVPPGTDDGALLRFTVPGERPREVRAVARVAEHRYFGRQGRDLTLRLPVTVPEAALGAVLTVPTLRGAVAMRLPPGTRSGRTFRVRGRGVESQGGPGDLLVTIEVVIPTDVSAEQRHALEVLATVTPSPRAHLEGDGAARSPAPG